MIQQQIATSNETQRQPKRTSSINASSSHAHRTATERVGVRGICGHISKSVNTYCGNSRCCPWGW